MPSRGSLRELLPPRLRSLIMAAAPFSSLPSASAPSGCDLTPVLLALLLSRSPHDAPPPPPHPPPQPSPGSRDLLQGRLRPHSPLSLIPRLLQQKMRQNASVAPPLTSPPRPPPTPPINISLVTAKKAGEDSQLHVSAVSGQRLSLCAQAAVAGRSGDVQLLIGSDETRKRAAERL